MSTINTQTPVVTPKPKKKSFTDDPTKRVIILDNSGIYVFSRSPKNVLKRLGRLDPSDFLNNWTSQKPITTGLMPEGTLYLERWSKANIDRSLVVFQFNPAIYHIRYEAKTSKNRADFKLSLPYVQMYIGVQKVNSVLTLKFGGITATQMPICIPTQSVFSLPLNNIYAANGTICWGYEMDTTNKPTDTDISFARRMAISFFQKPFNTDLSYRAVPEFQDIHDWHSKTEKDPDFGKKLSLHQFDSSLSTFTQYVNFVRGQV